MTTDRQLLELSKEYLHKLEQHTEKVVQAVSDCAEIRKSFEDAKKSYDKWVILRNIILILSPYFLLFLMAIIIPCNIGKIDLGFAKIETMACEKQNISDIAK